MRYLAALIRNALFGAKPLLNPIHAMSAIIRRCEKHLSYILLFSGGRTIEYKLKTVAPGISCSPFRETSAASLNRKGNVFFCNRLVCHVSGWGISYMLIEIRL